MQMIISYWNAQMSQKQALQVANLFSHTLEVVLDNPSGTVNDLDLFSKADRDQVSKWNNTDAAPEARSIEDRIRQHAVEQPSSVAISTPDLSLSYASLDRYSSLLAQYLAGRGVGGTAVSIAMKKSAWTVVAMLAVLRAGAAFFFETNGRQLQSAKMRLISRRHPALVPEQGSPSIVVDQVFLDGLATETLKPMPGADWDSIAFIIDSVPLDRRAFYTSISQVGRSLGMNAETRALQLAPYSSNISMTETFATLSHGGCLVVPTVDEQSIDIGSFIARNAVNWACLSPSVARLISPADVPSLKTLLLAGGMPGGDNATAWSVKLDLFSGYWVKQACGFPLINRITPGSAFSTAIGRPAGGHCWIASPWDAKQLVPVGCVGDLIIENASLARETADASPAIKNMALSPSVLRTGDLVRYAIDGTVELVRRSGDLYRVDGHQFQLDKIESQIRSFDYIRDAVASVPKVGVCAEQLTAMVTLAEVKTPAMLGALPKRLDMTRKRELAVKTEITRIREDMLKHLPLYMIPAVWAVVDSLPLDASGIVDRVHAVKFFEEMDEAEHQRITEEATDMPAAPGSSVEYAIREIWGRVLNQPVDQIGASRSFLSLGGDSITAMQVVSQCRGEGIQATVRDVLRCRSLADLASRAEVVGHVPAARRDEDSNTPFGLSPIQQTYFELVPEGQNHYNQSFLGRFTRRKISLEELRHAVEALVMQHPMLRARFHKTDAGWMQTITKEAAHSYHLNGHRASTRAETKEVTSRTQKSLDIQKGPILAADLFDISEGEEQALFIVIHHLVVDIVSWRVILHDLEALLEKETLPTGSSVSFQTWSRLKDEHIQSISPEDALPTAIPTADYAYWEMENVPNTIGEASHGSFSLGREETAVLLSTKGSGALRIQPIDIILGAVAHSFAATFSDRPLPAIFNEGHGREPWDDNIDLWDTVGWFTTLCPLSISNGREKSVINAIRGFRDVRRLIPGNGRPYFDCRYLSRLGRQAFQYHAKAEIMLNYTGPYQHPQNENALLKPIELDDMSFAADVAREMPRGSLIDILVKGEPDGMRFHFFYSQRMRHQDRIKEWIGNCRESISTALKALDTMAFDYAPTDFPLLSMEAPELDQLLKVQFPTMGVFRPGPLTAQIEAIFPCSPIQQGMLFSQMRASGRYETFSVWEATTTGASTVSTERLHRAWEEVVQRHAALRTVFVEGQDGAYIQVVLTAVAPAVEMVETDLADADEIKAMLVNLEGISFHPHRLSHKLTICKAPSQRVFCKLELNHILIDGSSVAVLANDLRRAYDNVLDTVSRPLYSDYIAYVQQQDPEESLGFWIKQLADVHPCHFPCLNDGSETDAGSATPKLLSREVVLDSTPEDIADFCSRTGITIANVFQVAWGLVLRAYTGSDNVCFGYLTSGRDAPISDIAEIVGPLINMLVCSLDITGLGAGGSIESLLHRVQQDFLNSLPHQHCSLAQIQHALPGVSADLFNTILSLQRSSPPSSSDYSLSLGSIIGHDPTEV